jgi:hypothetical protein
MDKIEIHLSQKHLNVLKARKIDPSKFFAECIEVFLMSDFKPPEKKQ